MLVFPIQQQQQRDPITLERICNFAQQLLGEQDLLKRFTNTSPRGAAVWLTSSSLSHMAGSIAQGRSLVSTSTETVLHGSDLSVHCHLDT